ncbi:flagellar basal body rod protein FlgB [Trinickia dinghuensis]|uniref:Flagellar basal body rod protein FlgB n=1 Tax=Trinickia dinghuensis TaxID=2291023 RepID=A0A3D8JZU0_9BURK|nr:flagellar basal body rod protein FlgB [Trinickia dinghuensis]RDU98352.1 flagellar basal body rod protein FlgB [Trinickia dinghuensis]
MLDKLDAEFAFGREALDVRAYRQELLSSNIANADTPGYKARDVNFGSSLAVALKRSGAAQSTSAVASSGAAQLPMAQPAGVTTGMTMASTESGHMTGRLQLTPTGGETQDYGTLAYRIPTQPSLDGNTVDLDSERVQFADNTLHYESGMTEVTNQMKQLLSAITSGG